MSYEIDRHINKSELSGKQNAQGWRHYELCEDSAVTFEHDESEESVVAGDDGGGPREEVARLQAEEERHPREAAKHRHEAERVLLHRLAAEERLLQIIIR